MEWVSQIGPFKVEKRESPRPDGQPYKPMGPNPSFCVHTTEGDTVDGAWNTLNTRHSAPHFLIGENRIVQMRPLSAQGATLVNHNDRFIQVEVVGHAKLALHELTPSSWLPLVALTQWVHNRLLIPLARPLGWTDELGSGVWASNNERRQSGKALTMRGVFGHVDVPDQAPTWHWDPGSLNYTALFKAALEVDEMTDAERAKLDAAFATVNGVEDYLKGTPPPAGAHPARVKAYKALTSASKKPIPTTPGPHSHALPAGVSGPAV